MKAGEPNFVFRTLPGTKPVTRMELGGALGTVRDKIFVSTGSEVKGFTKKGKLFLQFETNLAEAIETMYISGSNLMVCGNYVYNHYNDCRVEFLNFDIWTFLELVEDLLRSVSIWGRDKLFICLVSWDF